MDQTANVLHTIPLLMLRISPAFLSSSIEPMARIPLLIRMFAAVSVSICAALSIEPGQMVFDGLERRYIQLVMSEFFIGIVIVCGVQFSFAAISTFAHLLDNQIGLTASGVVNPSTNTSDGPVAMIFSLLAAVLFFEFNVHLDLLNLIISSYSTTPIGANALDFDVAVIVKSLSLQFLLALVVVLPIAVVMLMVDIAIAFSAKSMPNINIYFVSLPLKLIAGILTFSFVAASVGSGIQEMFSKSLHSISFLA